MSDYKQFRITVYLHNFFNDHRSVSRLFIKNKIKSVGDLHEYISNIFKIQNFYFVCNNHFLPNTEDIRVIQPDDVIIVIPEKTLNENHVITSTPITKISQEETIKEKNSRRCNSEEIENIDYQSDDLSEKKKLKRKREKRSDAIKSSNVCTTLEVDQLPRKKKKIHLEDNFDNNQVTNKTSKKGKKKHKIQLDSPVASEHNLQTTLINFKCEEPCAGVKEKVIYFEQHLSTEKSPLKDNAISNSVNQETKFDQKCSTSLQHETPQTVKNVEKSFTNENPETPRTVKNIEKSFTNENPEDNLPNSVKEVKNITKNQNMSVNEEMLEKVEKNKTSFSNKTFKDNLSTLTPQEIRNSTTLPYQKVSTSHGFKNRNLVITRRNDIKPLDLQKDTNIVKSMIVSHKPYEREQIEIIEISSKDEGNLNKSQNKLHVNSSMKESSYECYILENMKPSLSKENKKISHDNSVKVIQDVSFIKQMDKTNTSQSVQIINDDSVTNNDLDKCTYNIVPTTHPDVNEITQSLASDCTLSKDVTPKKSFVVNSSNSVENNQAVIEDKRISFAFPKILSSMDDSILNLSTESEPAFNTSNDPQLYCTSDFVTKRKRRRSHRKRKSTTNLSDDSALIGPIAPVKYKPPATQAAPILHIKFDDNGDPINSENVQNISENKISQSFEIIENNNLTKDKGTLEKETIPAEDMKMDHEHILETNLPDVQGNKNEVINIEKNILHDGPIKFSEGVILSAPVMTKIFPRIGDLIAFKILRITENYTPEVSMYIVGKVLKFDELTKDIGMYIIDGLEQCEEPQGKFSLEIETVENDNTNIKYFTWQEFIEPRLLFP